ncbi:MAG: hypothetical protein KY468_19685, partial [Armatimonadetes bacterium]|nr:hypothetical protein [Armatimonadota bacterium]
MNARPWKATRLADAGGLTGRWRVTMPGRDGNTFVRELVLTQDGEKVTGTLKAPAGGGGGNFARDIEIRDATFRDGELAFATEFRLDDGRTFRRSYRARMKGNALEGTSEGAQGGQGNAGPRPWKAERIVETPISAAGEWTLSLTREGRTLTPTMVLRQEGERWGGDLVMNINGTERRIPLQDVTVDGENVRFIIPAPPGGTGNTEVTAKFQGNTISGSVKGSRGTDLFTGSRNRTP